MFGGRLMLRGGFPSSSHRVAKKKLFIVAKLVDFVPNKSLGPEFTQTDKLSHKQPSSLCINYSFFI